GRAVLQRGPGFVGEGAQEGFRPADQQAAAIAGEPVGGDAAAVGHAREGGDRGVDERARRLVVELGDHAEAACVALGGRVVEPKRLLVPVAVAGGHLCLEEQALGVEFPNAGEGGTAQRFRRNVRYQFAAGIPELNTVAAVPQAAPTRGKYMQMQPSSARRATAGQAYPQRRETMRFSSSSSTLRRAPLNSSVTAWPGRRVRTESAPASVRACSTTASLASSPTRPCTAVASQLAGGGAVVASPGSAADSSARRAASSACSCSSSSLRVPLLAQAARPSRTSGRTNRGRTRIGNLRGWTTNLQGKDPASAKR